jgi:transposase-like protein
MAYLRCAKEDNKIKIETQEFFLELPDTRSNRKVCVVFLRSLKNKGGKRLYKLKQLAKIVDSDNRQAASEHVEQFRASGEDIGDFLKRKRKIDEEVLSAIEAEINLDPLVEVDKLTRRVNERLKRGDISVGNVECGLDEISCKVMRRAIKRKLKRGEVSYDEKYLLEMAFSSLSEIGSEREVSQLERADIEEYKEPCGMKLVRQKQSDVEMLLKPNVSVSSISGVMKCIIFCLVLYYWGVPLSVIGNWLKVHKTTVLRWIIALACGLWQVIENYIVRCIDGTRVYIDEKWIKIRGVWYYWMVVLDIKTNTPIYWCLTISLTKYSCMWVMFKLKIMGYKVKAFITDGFSGYVVAIAKFFPEAIHQLCHFHFQFNTMRWLRDNFENEEDIQQRRILMQKVLQTNDKRTLKRRFEKLVLKSKLLGITDWIKHFAICLPKLIPAVGSKVIPRTINGIERFFRAFMRFYKTRSGFHSFKSATREFILFVVVYLFTRSENGKAPIEAIFPDANRTPFYQLVNNPLQILLELSFVKKPLNGAIFQYSLAQTTG